MPFTLIDRSKRKASLTNAGEAFYQEALALSRQYEKMLDRMFSLRDTARQVIRVGALPVLTQYGLTARIKNFRNSHPGASILLDEAEEQ